MTETDDNGFLKAVHCPHCQATCVTYEGAGSDGDGDFGAIYECFACGARWVDHPLWVDDTGTTWDSEEDFYAYGIFLDDPPDLLEQYRTVLWGVWYDIRRVFGVPVDDIPF